MGVVDEVAVVFEYEQLTHWFEPDGDDAAARK